MRAVGGPIAFETFYNEIGDNNAEAHVEFELACLDLFHRDGFQGIYLNKSVGEPGFDKWPVYEQVLHAMWDNDFVGLHEYWADEADLHDAGKWHALRFTNVQQLRDKKIIINEAGRDWLKDLAEQGRYAGKRGWKKTTNAGQMLKEYRWYESQCPANVIGITPFTIGRHGKEWDDYDCSEFWLELVQSYESEITMTPTVSILMEDMRLSQGFGENPVLYDQWGLDGHNGIDLVASHGAEIRALTSGRAYVGGSDGYGLYVYVYSPWSHKGHDVLYAHLSDMPNGLKRVSVGDVVGYVGYSGNTIPRGIDGTHVHLGVRPRPYQLSNGYRGYVDALKAFPEINNWL